jgi:hypothetical protein
VAYGDFGLSPHQQSLVFVAFPIGMMFAVSPRFWDYRVASLQERNRQQLVGSFTILIDSVINSLLRRPKTNFSASLLQLQ